MENEIVLEGNKWRIVQINTNIPAAMFYTIQFANYHALGYSEVKNYQHFLKPLSKDHNLELGLIGDSYGDWQHDKLPEFANLQNTDNGK